MNKRVGEWVSEWLSEWVSEWVGEWVSELETISKKIVDEQVIRNKGANDWVAIK